MKEIKLPLSESDINSLVVGECVYLSGVIYTGRDAAHKRITTALAEGKQLPFELKGQTIYYVGPCPRKPGHQIGSCGPTTSYRCDTYTPALLEAGLKGMIGKGFRSDYVIDAMIRNKAVYFSGIGGAGALYSSCVKKADVIAYEDLGAEAVYRLEIEKLPVIVAIDSFGKSIFTSEN